MKNIITDIFAWVGLIVIVLCAVLSESTALQLLVLIVIAMIAIGSVDDDDYNSFA